MNLYQDQIVACRRCNATVYMYEGGQYDQLEGRFVVGFLRGTRNNHASEQYVYLPHQCQELKIVEHTQRKAEIVNKLQELNQGDKPTWSYNAITKAEREGQTLYRALEELIHENALTRECPRCHVLIGEPCENLSERKRNNKVPTKRPHDERIPHPDDLPLDDNITRLRQQTFENNERLAQLHTALKSDKALTKLIEIAERF